MSPSPDVVMDRRSAPAAAAPAAAAAAGEPARVIPAHADRALVEVLTPLRDRPFLLVQPGGNWGDFLIYRGLEHLADVLGLRWTATTFEDLPQAAITPDHVVYVHGSGGLNRWSSPRAIDGLRLALESPARTVIQGPCTVEADADFARDLAAAMVRAAAGKEFHFFAREHVTHDLMAPVTAGAALHLNDDTAFYMPGSVLLQHRPRRTTYNLLALRRDPEAPDTRQGTLRGWVRLDPAYFGRSFGHWVEMHARARRIITNRTHSTIAGCILGAPTTMLGNAYHKNRSIWEYSLARRGVAWGSLDDYDLRPREAFPGATRLQKSSWKMSLLVHWLQGVPVA